MLNNVALEHFIIQTSKKSKPALINFMGAGGPRAEKNKYPEKNASTEVLSFLNKFRL